MKASGIVRRVDDLGRVVIPKEIRRILRINEGCPMEIIPTQEGILLKKYYAEESLSDLISSINEEVEELCKDLGPERTGDIRRHLREIQRVLNPERKR
ncbi:AbrB/MazE/SpoVT family DNA-binding domain-containing protein [Lacrimispora sp. JR3]|uniref:AbrB/MazE/SpoVT family DNA-binding domain-containing protein n=1 Tax=Lacrimispora sinapis TaxID=3111456 RepID=UPI003748CCF5